MNPADTSSPRGIVVEGALVAGILIVAVTEGLGAVKLLRPLPLGLAWLAILVAALAWSRIRRSLRLIPTPVFTRLAEAPVLWGCIVACLGLTFLAGFFGAPNVSDALAYHLPRVERWVQQGTLGFWPTSVDRQLWTPPFGGYAMLQLRLLTGGDRLAFLPSWLAYFGLILLTIRVVHQLGGSARHAVFGGLVMATMPVAVLHASSVQTDLLAAFWVLCAASLVLEAWQQRAEVGDWKLAAWLAAAASLAILTKPTAWLALAPLLLLFALAMARENGFQALGRPLLIGILAVLVVNGPHFARNAALYGDPLGDPITRSFLSLTPWSLPAGLANLLANLSLHLGLPWDAWNNWWTASLSTLTEAILRQDMRSVFPYFGGFRVQAFAAHEAVSGNPAHVLVAILVCGAVLLTWSDPRTVRLKPWIVAGVAAVLLHMVLIRWQPYGSRLQLPVLIWIGPVVGVLAGVIVRRLASVALLITALPALAGNSLRPLLGERSVFVVERYDQYFVERPDWRPAMDNLSESLNSRRCTVVGFVGGYDSAEYLLRLVMVGGRDTNQLQHLAPQNRSATLSEAHAQTPDCGIVVTDRGVETISSDWIRMSAPTWSVAGVTFYENRE
jgi:hypothetical protein